LIHDSGDIPLLCGNGMDESVATENEGQARQKPALSRLRIAGEILAGAVGGLVGLAPLFACVSVADFFQDYAGLGVLILLEPVFPLAYAFGLAVGVYLIGRRGKQTGSFLATFGCGFIGDIAALFLFLLLIPVSTSWTTDVGKMVQNMVLWIGWILLLLIPPIFPTLGFNLTRRYKKSSSSCG
jgi:hypothetical protein